MTNKEWSEKILKSLVPSFRHRWEVYEDYLRENLNNTVKWLYLGCGNNADVEEKRDMVRFACGIDIYKNEHLFAKPFVISDITNLPIKANSVDVISLRFVVEHISDPQKLFGELLHKILRPNGIVVIITTNIWSPVIFLPKILPYSLRKKLMEKLFNVEDDEIFLTYHRFNSFYKVKLKANKFNLKDLEFIQDLNTNNRMIFSVFLLWHIITKIKFLKIFRSNFIAVYRK